VKEKKTLDYKDVVAVIDTREQKPLTLDPLKTIVKGLKTADYSIVNHETEIAVEVKALDDFIGCCTWGRERFERELVRMQSYKWRLIVIKSHWHSISLKQYRSQTAPLAVLGSAMSFAGRYNVSIVMAGDHDTAGTLVARFLWVAANDLHREKLLRSQGKDDRVPMVAPSTIST
jgi:ERCC4-type nuclease